MDLVIAAAAVVVVGSLVVRMMMELPDLLQRATARRMGNGVPQFGRYILISLAVAVGTLAIVGALIGPAPTLYGAVALLITPLWRVKPTRRHEPLLAPLQYGMEIGQRWLYILGSVAVIVGILRDAALNS